jgi:multicomponent K+:H+ antiporter subunit G
MSLSPWLLLELFLAAILVGGGIFALVGSYGLLRLPRPMQRLHAPTKATTIGVGAALLVSGLDLLPQGGGISWQELLITLFLLLTAPISALFLAKTLILRGEADPDLPDPGTGTPWATLADDQPDP